MTSLFNERKLVFAINGPWFRGETEAEMAGALLFLESPVRTSPLNPIGVEALMMSARSVRKAEAFKVMRALTTDEAAYTRWKDARQLV